MDELKFIVFRLGNEKYSMNLEKVSGIEREYHIIPVPNAPADINGIINIRGEVIPVYSLRTRFGMDRHVENPEKSLLLTRTSGTVIAYEVDEVLGISQMVPSDIVKMPRVASNENTDFMENVLRVKKDIVIVINVDKVLSKEIQSELERLIEENKQSE